ncbi:MAG: glycine zipper 2TM domain-containing protein [Comamonas sp.]
MAGAAALGSAAARAGEPLGRVLSATPVIQQVAVPSQVCSPERYVTREPNSGAGAVVGAIAGGLLGNTVGHGSGRAVATMAGVLGGAVVGNQLEGGGGTRVHDVNRCYNDTAYEERTVGYKVVYEYAGRQYQTRLDHDPGDYIPLQVRPSGAVDLYDSGYPAGTTTVTTTVRRAAPVYVEAQPVYVEPGYYRHRPPPPGWGPQPRDRWDW